MKYPFKCSNCNEIFEIEIPISKYDEIKDKLFCENCGSKLKRVFNEMNFILKGAGWFRDHLYGITEREMQTNRDKDAKLEEQVRKKQMSYQEALSERP